MSKVEPDNVALTVLKFAGSGTGCILRIHETEGQPTTLAQVRVAPHWQSARICNLVEEDIGEANLANGCLHIELRPHQLATIRLL